MYEVITRQPLPSEGQEWQDLRNGKLPSPLPGNMPCLDAIVKEMMHPDPEKRPTATELLARDAILLVCEVNDKPLHVGTPSKGSSYKVHSARKSISRPSLKRSASWIL